MLCAFFGIGPMELVIVGGLCLLLPAIVGIVLYFIMGRSNKGDE